MGLWCAARRLYPLPVLVSSSEPSLRFRLGQMEEVVGEGR